MSEWIETTVGEIAASTRNALVGGPFGSNLVSKDYVDHGVPVIRGQNMGARWVAGDFAYVSQEKAQSLSANTARPGDLVFTQRGTLGQVALVPNDPFTAYVVSQSQMKLSADPEKADPVFLYYLFSSPIHQEYIRQNAIQVGVPHTNLGILRDTPLYIPKEVDEQKAIARYLGSLDDKIELNRRMNETLEAMARAIFQSWFVDFDPVRAKASGEPAEAICQRLGLTPEILVLFPDGFQESELSKTPLGWLTKRLPDVIAVNPIRTLKKGAVAPYLDMANMPTGSARARELVLREFGSGMKFQNGDTLVARITPCLENGKTCFVDFLEDGEIGWGSTEYIVLCPKPPLPKEFAYFLARTESFRCHAIARMTGSSGRQRVPAAAFDDVWLAVPSEELAVAFGLFVSSIMESMRVVDGESRSLMQIRDTFLPKLLSGELTISAKEAIA